MKKGIEYVEIETPAISIEKKQNMMKEIFKVLEELKAISKDTSKTSKEICIKLPKVPTIKDLDNVKKTKKSQLNTPSFVGSLAGVMSKFGILGKLYSAEKKESKWYITGNIKMLNDIKPKDM
ncbi:hypothetical protein LGK97_00195 [Clostridium sp. CS001]|uniref:hypothetical protein n=1 Tax=Clostridium sp. CS001 TaxID=2880648 RepID=UPI001CF509E1|nr:hypothetical protein [Clostridium sp. CS001]MCB2288182.1 hypothetical protein [Clostridium sp. CS001]